MKCFHFAQTVKALRKQAGLTIEKEAVLFGVKKSRVSMWECGSVPRWEVLLQIARYYKVSLDTLLGNLNEADSLTASCL